MFQRIQNSWALVKASWAVLRADKELIVFPIVSAIAAIIVTLSFIVPFVATGVITGFADDSASRITTFVLGFLFYLVQYTVIFYCNTALIGAALIRLRGGDPTVRDGFRIASQHFGSIIGYALISSTVGMILRSIRERGILGQIAAGLFGLAWNVATYLVVPVLVIENVGPIEAIKRSTALLKKTWGEQIVGNLGIGAVFGLLFFALFLLGLPLIALGASTGSAAIIVLMILVWIMAMVFLGLISSALSGIYTAAVYQYVATGNPGTYFDQDQIKNAFRPK
ncbi:MAG TPA: DUF6159 family protein [Anaerolineae bacterium]